MVHVTVTVNPEDVPRPELPRNHDWLLCQTFPYEANKHLLLHKWKLWEPGDQNPSYKNPYDYCCYNITSIIYIIPYRWKVFCGKGDQLKFFCIKLLLRLQLYNYTCEKKKAINLRPDPWITKKSTFPAVQSVLPYPESVGDLSCHRASMISCSLDHAWHELARWRVDY